MPKIVEQTMLKAKIGRETYTLFNGSIIDKRGGVVVHNYKITQKFLRCTIKVLGREVIFSIDLNDIKFL